MIKRILIIICTVIIAISGFFTGFFSVGCMSVYAAVNDDSVYVSLRDPSDLVVGFQSYCKSRDLTIEGSLADAVTTFTTGAFNSACNEIGINITQLQAELKAEYDSSGKPVKFLFNDTGIMAMNRIFAQFLQDNELQVGDENVNKVVFDGYFYVDNDGNSCLVWDIKDTVLSPGKPLSDMSQYVNKRGTNYCYTRDELVNYINLNSASGTRKDLPSMHIGNYTYKMRLWLSKGTDWTEVAFNPSGYTTRGSIYYDDNGVQTRRDGFPILYVLNGASGDLHLGTYIERTNGNFEIYNYDSVSISPLSRNDLTSITIVSNTINNNTYEGDTIINNEGDVINNPQPQQPNNPNDTIHNVHETPLSPNDDGGWDIDLPDIDIPNLPIGNLSEKFPFSIPWDLVAFYAMLDAEPQAPRFNGTMDLTLVQWNYDIDLAPFDSAAELCRKLQFGLFVVGLIVASRSIIRG